MKQTKICSYYKTSCAQTHFGASFASFPSLPVNLRDRIYCDAGLVTGASLRILQSDREHLKEWMRSQCTASFRISGPGGVSFLALTTAGEPDGADWEADDKLMVCNRAVQADVSRYICAHNEIPLCCKNECHLLLLHKAPRCLIRALRSLIIHLDVASSHERGCRTSDSCCHRDCTRLPQCRSGK